jgi:hypothetical protein
MKTPFIIISLFVLFSITLFAQSTHWQRYFSGRVNEDGYDICTSSNGNIYTGGLTTDPGNGWLLKLNPYGDTLWTRKLFQIELINAIEPTPDNGCIVGGRGFKVVRFSSLGDTIWNTVINAYEINDISKTSDGNYVLCGSSGIWTPFACKINGNGIILWQKYFSNINRGYLNSVINSIDGGIIFAGTAGSGADTGLILKTDINGNFVWNKTYTMYNSNTVFKSITANNSSYFVSGYSYPLNKIFIIKTNITGDTVKTISSISNDEEPQIVRANSNKFYISCWTGNYSSKIFSIDSNLNIIKQLILSPVRNYLQVFNINIYNGDNSGDILLTGAIDISQQLSEELYAARIDSSLTTPPGIGIQRISSEIPKSYSLSQNYPNPFNPVTKIRFSIPLWRGVDAAGSRGVLLKVYDILGREIAMLVNEQLKPGTYEVSWPAPTGDVSNYPSGVYFYKLITNEYTISKKMVLLK